MRSVPALMLLALATGAAPALASKAHAHGVMALNVALEGPVLAVQLDAPQDTLVGHERRPKPGVETTAANAVLALLRDTPRWLKPDAAAGCALGTVVLQPGRLLGPAQPGEKDGDHADVGVSVQWRCQTPAALKSLEVGLFNAFSRVSRIDVQVAGGSGPAKQVLRKGNARVVLAR